MGESKLIYRLLALSLHHTIVDNQGRVDKSIKQALQYAENKGIQIAFITSLPYTYVKKMTKSLKVQAKVVSHHGAYITANDEKPVYVRRIQDHVASNVVTLLEAFPCDIIVTNERVSLRNQLDEQKNLKAKAIYSPGDRTPYQLRYCENLVETIETENVSPLHIEVQFENSEDLLDVQKVLNGMFNEIETTIHPHNQLTILPVGVSKLKSFHYLADYLKVSINETVGIGYDMEDLEWMETCGLIVAMGDSPKQLREKADWITRSAEENGVAYMVMEHFRKQQPIEFLKKMNIID